jgi:glycosyltransferase involved in cell wall biosynthesis
MVKHVVVVTDSLSIDGGSSNVALRSAVALARMGMQVTVFAASGEAGPELLGTQNLRVISTGQGDALGASNRLLGALRGLWNAKAYREMSKLLASLDPTVTVVHLHGWTKALSSSVVASVVHARFRIVLTLHEYFTACPVGCFYLHRDKQVCTLKPMSLACILKDCDSRSYAFKLYRVVRQAVQLTFGRIPSGIAHYITVSAFSRRVIEPMLPKRRIMYAVDNPVDVPREARACAELNEHVVFVGRLSAEKGGALLAEAARIAGLQVLFIGEGPERSAIERANPDARFSGWLDRDGVTAALRGARCVVVPSLWYETLGLVVLEAAALGIPAIVPNGTAARDLIVAGQTGLVFSRGDVSELVTVLRASTDDALIERMSRAAYELFWKRPPTMRAHVDGLLAAYRGVLGDVAPLESVARAS